MRLSLGFKLNYTCGDHAIVKDEGKTCLDLSTLSTSSTSIFIHVRLAAAY